MSPNKLFPAKFKNVSLKAVVPLRENRSPVPRAALVPKALIIHLGHEVS